MNGKFIKVERIFGKNVSIFEFSSLFERKIDKFEST